MFRSSQLATASNPTIVECSLPVDAAWAAPAAMAKAANLQDHTHSHRHEREVSQCCPAARASQSVAEPRDEEDPPQKDQAVPAGRQRNG